MSNGLGANAPSLLKFFPAVFGLIGLTVKRFEVFACSIEELLVLATIEGLF